MKIFDFEIIAVAMNRDTLKYISALFVFHYAIFVALIMQ